MHVRRVLSRLTALGVLLGVLLALPVPVDDSGLREGALNSEADPPKHPSGMRQAGFGDSGPATSADDATHRSHCSPTGEDSATHQATHHEYLDKRRRDLRGVADRLIASRDPEHMLAAAILGTDKASGDRIRALAVALDADPRSLPALWHLLRACTDLPSAPECADIGQRLLQAGDSNGAHWAQIALYREAQGDLGGALEALTQAYSATDYRNHWIESVMMLERGFAASTSYTYAQRVAEAFGIAAVELSLEGDVLRACNRHASGSLEWQRVCLSFGGMLELKGGTVLGQALGLALQLEMLKISDRDGATAAVKQRQTQFRAEVHDDMTRDAVFLWEHDENALRHYLEVFEVHGEKSARQFARSEAERLKSLPGYEPCPQQPAVVPAND